MQELFEQFIKQCWSQGKSPVTIKNYKENYKLLVEYKPDLQLSDINKKSIIDFFEYLRTRPRMVGKEMVVRELKNSTLATIRGKLNVFFEWLIDNKHIKKNPFEKIEYPKFGFTDKRALTKEEFDKICLMIMRDIKWTTELLKKRNLAIIMFLILTGVRKNELLGLKLSDIDMKKKIITVPGEISKSKRTRLIPFSKELASYLEEYFAEREDYKTEWLWVSNNGDYKFTEHGLKHFIVLLKKQTGINCHVHRFRHTFATIFQQQLHDIDSLRKVLGHKDDRMTKNYLRSMPYDDVVRQMGKVTLAKFR